MGVFAVPGRFVRFRPGLACGMQGEDSDKKSFRVHFSQSVHFRCCMDVSAFFTSGISIRVWPSRPLSDSFEAPASALSAHLAWIACWKKGCFAGTVVPRSWRPGHRDRPGFTTSAFIRTPCCTDDASVRSRVDLRTAPSPRVPGLSGGRSGRPSRLWAGVGPRH